MTVAEPFLRAALYALDEAGDPTAARPILEQALIEASPLISFHKPASPKKVVAWAASQMAMSADDPARAYSRLRELLLTLFDPLPGSKPAGPPAPEVAMAMAPAELVEALAPSPRVIVRALAAGMKLDARALLVEPALERRVLGLRAIPQASIGSFARELAAVIAGGVPALRAEALEVCAPAADKTRIKVAEALQPLVVDPDAGVRAAAIDGVHALRFQLDNVALLAALRDPEAEVRAAAVRTIGTGRRGYGAEVEQQAVGLMLDIDVAVRIAALGAIVRSPSLLAPELVEPLRAAVGRGGDEGKTALFLLGRLGTHPNTAALDVSATDDDVATPAPEPRAYVIIPITDGFEVSDRGTGKQLFVVAQAAILVFIPKRAEVAAIRIEPRGRKPVWYFERYRVPTGECLGSTTIDARLTHGRPTQLAIAAELATVWCDHEEAYRFHVKLGPADAVIDEAPVLGRSSKK